MLAGSLFQLALIRVSYSKHMKCLHYYREADYILRHPKFVWHLLANFVLSKFVCQLEFGITVSRPINTCNNPKNDKQQLINRIKVAFGLIISSAESKQKKIQKFEIKNITEI